MPIEELERSGGKLLALKWSGKLTADEYKDYWKPTMEGILQEQGGLRLLVQIDDSFDGFEAGAVWEDAWFAVKHLGDGARGRFEKIAIVGGPGWIGRLAEMFGHLMPGEIESYGADQLEEAWGWVES